MKPTTRSHGTAAAFVDVTAKLALLMAALGVVWSLLQLVLVLALGQLDISGWMQRESLPVPASLVWAGRHATALTLLMLLLSLAFLAVSWALLKHREWGRIGFIVFLVVVALANFAMLPLVNDLFDAMHAILPADFMASPQAREMRIQLQASRWVSLLTAGGTALVFAVLHGWMVIKLCRRDVQTLFR